MSWMQKLYRTYESAQEKGLGEEDEPLTPIGHTLQTAHIVVVLDGAGDFQTARVMPPKTTIMLPATEASENRTSGEAPHPLADKIQYVAQDYATYGGEKKAYFDGYLKQLQTWCNSSFAHPKVKAVLDYVKKGTVVADLVQVGILPLDDNGKVASKWAQEGEAPPIFSVLPKTKGEIEFGSALVCWCVEITGDEHNETWTDKTVQQSWMDYAASGAGTKDFCFVQGEEAIISAMHPAKLRHTGDKAKLISSNDTAGYTFRGRFTDAQEAASVSAAVSAKAHSALRWLIARQGICNGDQVTVAWAISGHKIPSPMQDSFDEMDWKDLDLSAIEGETEMPSERLNSGIDWSVNIGKAAAEMIKKKLHGYRKELKEHEQISLLMLDSATPGRMALTYYQEFLPADYFANLDAWLDDVSWYQRHSIECADAKKSAKKRTVWAFVPPSPAAIAHTVYGKSLSDTLKKQLYARLLPVIAGGSKVPIPYDLVQKSFQAACNPYVGHRPRDKEKIRKENWERNISVACALYKGWYIRHHNSSQWRNLMSLDKENSSRDYLYGRLIAQAESLEWYALYLQNGKKTPTRATNAERYFQQFAQQPYKTWLEFESNKLVPYKNYLTNLGKDFYKDSIGEIMDLFSHDDFICNNKLSGEFLLGYHCQKMENNRQIAERKATKAKATKTTESN